MRITDTVKHLIIINVLVFIITVLNKNFMFSWFSLSFPENSDFQYWQIISHFFMHGSVGHIFFNMFGLWMFGSVLEDVWGGKKFLFFYFSTGIGAGLIHTGVNYYYFNEGLQALMEVGIKKDYILHLLEQGKYDTQWNSWIDPNHLERFIEAYSVKAVGASGALYGLLAAFAFLFPNLELMLLFLPIPIKAKYFVPILIMTDLFFGFTNIQTGTAHFAHIGGAIIGFLMIWYWKKKGVGYK